MEVPNRRSTALHMVKYTQTVCTPNAQTQSVACTVFLLTVTALLLTPLEQRALMHWCHLYYWLACFRHVSLEI